MHKKRVIIICVLLVVGYALLNQISTANAKDTGTGMIAPTWGETEWLNLPQGKKNLDVEDYRGRVVYLALFQQW